MAHKRLGLYIVCACFFMASLDITIVNIALPNMTASLHAPLSLLIWTINGYLLVYAALAIPAGRLGDILGQRFLFLIGLALFTVASVLCGISQSAILLIGARLLQGVGSACISAPSLALLTFVVPAERRGAALGLYASMVAVAGLVGPVLGGVLVSSLGWNWVFFLNVPIGIILFIGTLAFLPRVKAAKPHRFDIIGIVFAGVALFSIIFTVVEGPTYNWGNVVGPVNIPMFLIAGLALMVVFVFWERFQPEPFLPLHFFKNWVFASMAMVNTLLSFSAFGMVFLLTFYLEAGLGISAMMTGITLLPEFVAIFILSPLAGRLADKIGGKYVLITGLLGFALGMAVTAGVSRTNSNWLTLLIPLVLIGAGFACAMSSVMGEILRGVAPPMMGTASGIISVTRLVGGSIGVAATASFLQSQQSSAANSQIASIMQQIPGEQRQTFTSYLGSLLQNNGLPQTTLSLQFQHLAHQIYAESFIAALHSALIMVVIVLIMAALLTAFSARRAVPEKKDAQASASFAGKASVPQRS